jgi:hypothetical protein
MSEVGIWNVTGDVPHRYKRGEINLEKQLETWIAEDPTLIESGLQIVGRQLQLEAGVMDLLGIDRLGRWAIIEIKKGNVRRETFTQAIDYAACMSIDEMSPDELSATVAKYLTERGTTLEAFFKQTQLDDSVFEERDITIYVVGTGRDQNLERMTKFLKGSGIQINVVNFEVFENKAGERIILSKLTEIDTEPPALTKKSSLRPRNPQIDKLHNLADQNGIGETFRLIHEAALEHGLYPRTYKWSIMYTPPTNRTRVLLCSWAVPRKEGLALYISTRQFAEFYPISEREAVQFLGENRYEHFSPKTVLPFMKALDKLFKQIAKNS